MARSVVDAINDYHKQMINWYTDHKEDHSMTSDKFLVRIDPGSGLAKTGMGNLIRTFSSLYERHDEVTFDEFSRFNGQTKSDIITVDLGPKGIYRVGLTEAVGFNERVIGINRYKDPVWAKIMVTAALSKFPALVRAENPVVTLGVLTPYALLKDRRTGGMDVSKTLSSSMRGVFNVPFSKKIVDVRVSTVKVFGEGLAGFVHFAYDKDMKLKPQYRNTNTLYLDIGRGTINTAFMCENRPHMDTVRSEQWGTNLFYRMIARNLDQSAGTISPDRVESMIRSGEMTKQQKAVATDQSAIYIDTMISYARAVESQVDLPIDRLIVFGGGLKVVENITKTLDGTYPETLFGDEYTNLRGLGMLLGDDYESEESEKDS